MRTFAAIIMMLCVLEVSAQNEVLIKVQHQPRKEYRQTNIQTMDGEMNMMGDKAMMDNLAASGMTMPIQIIGSTEIEMTIKTSKMKKGRIPATMTYDKMKIQMQMMGANQDVDSPIEGAVITGWYDTDGKFTVESAAGMGESFSKEDLMNVINQVQQSTEFPDKPLKVGDTFTQKVPMNVPLASMGALSIFSESVYTVNEIKDGKAMMSVDMKIFMDNNSAMAASVIGEGTGMCIYDISNTFLTDLDMKLDYRISMEIQGMTMVMNMTGTTRQTTKIR